MDKLSLFDAHCDTAPKVLAGEDLADRSGPVSLAAADGLCAWGQIFAFCCEKQERRDDGLWEVLGPQLAAFTDRAEQKGLRINAELPCALLGIEGCEQLSHSDGVRKALDAGARIFGLTWNYDNRYCGAALGSGGGLTPMGEDLILQVEREGGILDLSHASEQGFYGACRCADRPFMASHSNCFALCGHPRNLKDGQIREIAAREGFIGINFYVPFLSEDGYADADRVCDHIFYMAELAGEHCVGLGMDLDGCDALPRGLCSMRALPHLARRLRERGAGEAFIRAVFYDNLLSFLQKNL